MTIIELIQQLKYNRFIGHHIRKDMYIFNMYGRCYIQLDSPMLECDAMRLLLSIVPNDSFIGICNPLGSNNLVISTNYSYSEYI